MESADLVLVPVVPDAPGVHAYQTLLAVLERAGRHGLRILPFLSMVDARSRVHRVTAAVFRAREAETLGTVIPLRSEVQAAAARRVPIVLARPLSASASAFRDLWAEIRSRGEVGGTPSPPRAADG